MDSENPISPVIQNKDPYPVPYFFAILLVLINIGIFLGVENVSFALNLQLNLGEWAKIRCQPHMIPLAGLFGQSVNENFEFCLQQIIQEATLGITGPFTAGMFGFTSILENLMKSANSFRVMLATLIAGIVKIINEFKARMTAMMGRVKLTAGRMKTLMYRVYGTMFAVIYMGISAQTGISNFGDTFIFKFIDTFCFPPEQRIMLESGESFPISEIIVNDILKGGHRVESIYKFAADGQEMVELRDVQVSSNHFIQYNGKWIMAKDHPDAVPIEAWSGGLDRPLYCLTTHDHKLPIGSYLFADYDETDEANEETQKWVSSSLNGRKIEESYESYEIGLPPTTMVKTLGGYKPLYKIKLGDKITERDTVVGIQMSETDEFCILPNNQRVAKGTLMWNKDKWLRAHTLYPSTESANSEVIALFVSPGAKYEILGDHVIRDAMEIYSPDTKKLYADALLNK